MTEIRIIGRYIPSEGGPSMPTRLSARITRLQWPGGGTMGTLVLSLGHDTVEIVMIEREQIEGLISSLQGILDRGELR